MNEKKIKKILKRSNGHMTVVGALGGECAWGARRGAQWGPDVEPGRGPSGGLKGGPVGARRARLA